MPETIGQWRVACDSYGKVRHSKKACVYTVVPGANGDQIVTIAARIENWSDAKLIAAAPVLKRALQRLANVAVWDEDSDRQEFDAAFADASAALGLAEISD